MKCTQQGTYQNSLFRSISHYPKNLKPRNVQTLEPYASYLTLRFVAKKILKSCQLFANFFLRVAKSCQFFSNSCQLATFLSGHLLYYFTKFMNYFLQIFHMGCFFFI